jgi:hypothetical protein
MATIITAKRYLMKQFSFEEFRGYDRGKKTRMVVVPDGRWVAEDSARWSSDEEYGDYERHIYGWSQSESTTSAVVGAEVCTKYTLRRDRGSNPRSGGTSHWGYSHSMLVSEEPFGIISGQKEKSFDDFSSQKERDGLPMGGLYFTSARQVHKGELGRLPQILMPQFARMSREYGEGFHEWREGQGCKPMPKRDRRRGEKGWARLKDVSNLAGMTPEEMVRGFFLFTHAETPALQVLFREHREDIHCRVVKHDSWETFHEHRLDELFARDDLKRAWIRQGFAKAVLYLCHLGYQPELPVQAIAV